MRGVCLCGLLTILLLSRGGASLPASPHHSALRTPHSALCIGLLIPQRGSRKIEGEEVRRGAEMAVAEANAAARRNGASVPAPRFELVVRADDGLWGAGSREIVNLVSDDRVCALLGAVDSASAHLIEQIVMKARIVFVTPWASDPTLTQIGIPWMFRCVSDDNQQAEALTREIFTVKRLQRVGVLIADDRSALLSADAFARAAEKSGHPIPQNLRWQVMENGKWKMENGLGQLQGVALFVPLTLEAKVTHILHHQQPSVTVFSPLSLLFRNPQSAIRNSQADSFRRNYRARYGSSPAPAAAYSYDATRVLLHAIRSLAPRGRPDGRPDRAAIRDALLRTKFEGVTGTIQFDRKGNRRVLSTK